MSELIKYRVEGPLFIISLDNPKILNSFKFSDYSFLADTLRKADLHPDTTFTVIQATGRFFSSGANISSVVETLKDLAVDEKDISTTKLIEVVASPIEYFGRTIAEHNKPIVGCLNGPAIGLSAAAICLCDVVFAMNENVYLHFPFSKLGMGTEGATSYTVASKFGPALAAEALLLGTPLGYDKLKDKLITRNYNLNDVDLFNAKVRDELTKYCNDSSRLSILVMTGLLRKTTRPTISRVVGDEMFALLELYRHNEPQKWFLRRSKELKSRA